MILQKSLINQDVFQTQFVYLKNVKASFVPGVDGFYDVVLEINSNKFFLSVQHIFDRIEEFNVVCIKGFVELSNKLILLLRQLLSHLFLRLS